MDEAEARGAESDFSHSASHRSLGKTAHRGQPQLYRAEQKKGEKGSESKAAPPFLSFSDSALKL